MQLTWKQRLSGRADSPAAPATPLLSYNPWTKQHWQSSTDHINYMRALLRQPMFQDALAVLHNSRPAPLLRGITDTEAAIALGLRQGYDQLLGQLLDLAILPPAPAEEVPITYGSERFDVNATS